MITITRLFHFDYGHRVLGHEGKCKHLHGHRGVVEVTVVAPDLDELGRVIDFSCVKQVVGDWIDSHWDHNILLHERDPLLQAQEVFAGKAPYVMKYGNPTAENISRELFEIASSLLFQYNVSVTKIQMHETPNCSATFTRGSA